MSRIIDRFGRKGAKRIVKNLFRTCVCYTPDGLFLLNLYLNGPKMDFWRNFKDRLWSEELMHFCSKSSIVLCWLNSCLQICRNKILMTNAWKLYISFAGGVEADGMWQATFVTFLVYAMMPLKTWVAVAFSTLIAVVHMSISGILTANPKIGLHWQQVRPNNFFDAFCDLIV